MSVASQKYAESFRRIKMDAKLVKLERKNNQYFFNGELLDWIKFPSTEISVGDAWMRYNKEGKCEGTYLAAHQCCTGILIYFCGAEVYSIIQLPIGIYELQVDPNDQERMLATGSACSGEGTISLYHNPAYGDWKWKNQIRGQRESIGEALLKAFADAFPK